MGESEKQELKESLSEWRDIVETVSAFSNAKGGTIQIGVSEDKQIFGVTIGKNTLEKLANQIRQNTDPSIFPSIEVENKDGNKVIVIYVKESRTKPVFAFGRAFKRVGKTNQRLGHDEIRKLSLQTSKTYWDEQICEDADLEDIDKDKVKWFLEKVKAERKSDISLDISVKESLERLNLIKNNSLTNAAVLLFGKNPQRFFSQSEVRCARFKGTKPLEFIDMKVFDGDIIDQREDAVEFVKEHIKLHAKIVGTERVETWEYPIEAIREAITNAICHRDYEIASNVQVRIFDDRIEIWGVGPLPEPLTIEDLRGKHDSVLRNPLIGKCFFLIKYIEEWGTGTNRIIKSCLDHDLPEPLFEEISGSLIVTFRKKMTEGFLREKDLNERQIEAVKYLEKNERIERKTYSDIFDVGATTAYKELDEMREKGIIKRKGKGRGTYYVL
ncbi:MAG: RNA-binding domain-containing protein [Petrotogales bacterium]